MRGPRCSGRLVLVEAAIAQYTNGVPLPTATNSSGLSTSTTYGSFGQRSYGGMMNSATKYGAFGQHDLGGMMNSSRGAGTFTGSAGIAKSAVCVYSLWRP